MCELGTADCNAQLAVAVQWAGWILICVLCALSPMGQSFFHRIGLRRDPGCPECNDPHAPRPLPPPPLSAVEGDNKEDKTEDDGVGFDEDCVLVSRRGRHRSRSPYETRSRGTYQTRLRSHA